MDETVKGLTLSSVTYKDKDKILSVFTLEKGIISCKAVGALNSNAKMKAVKEPFCFAELSVVSKGTNNVVYTITSANVIESFYNLTTDINKFYAGCLVLEIVKKVLQPEVPNTQLFLQTVKAIKTIAFDLDNPKLVVCKFLISIFESMGYALSLQKCASCGSEFLNKRYLNINSGEVVCFSCKSYNSVEISSLAHACMRLLNITDYEKLKNLKLKKEGINEAFKLLVSNFENRFETSLSSINKFPE